MAALRKFGIALAVMCGLTVGAFGRDFTMPRANPAKTYAAHDSHSTEKLTIAADPYDTPEKANVFKTDYLEHALLPIYVVITNDGDEPVSLVDMKVQLVTRDRAKASPSTEQDIYRHITSTSKIQDDSRGATRIPLPLPKKSKRAVSKDAEQEIDTALFRARAVEPHATQSGFVFFDVGNLEDPASGARLYATGVRDGRGQELMYFEISFEKPR